ncbi:MAG: hypothetical protein HUU22_15995 [Phycisphaerae bacterium]|nr:hypothetical protein [Phycisphaerae bacterium]NUQ47522.1 hypothetical protein [Phycisphaerae bacterium]
MRRAGMVPPEAFITLPRQKILNQPASLGLVYPMIAGAETIAPLGLLNLVNLNDAADGGPVISATAKAPSRAAVIGKADGAQGIGIRGEANNGALAIGVKGDSTAGIGVRGTSTAAGNGGVEGRNDNADGFGVKGDSTAGIGVKGTSEAADNGGVEGRNDNADGFGAKGDSTAGIGVKGTSEAAGKGGVEGRNDNADGFGVKGDSTAGIGVKGTSTAALMGGVEGRNDNANGSGVAGRSIAGTGVTGTSAAANRAGVSGFSPGVAGDGLISAGVAGISLNDVGVFGGNGILTAIPLPDMPIGVVADTATGIGVLGYSGLTLGSGVVGRCDGVFGDGLLSAGIDGESWNDVGVGGASVNGVGVAGWSINGWGIYGVRNAGTLLPSLAFAAAITGDTDAGNGVVGTSAANGGAGLFGDCPGPLSAGARGISAFGVGTVGDTTTGIGVLGRRGVVTGMALINPAAIVGDTSVGDGVTGLASFFDTAGVVGRSSHALGYGVVGINHAGGLAGNFFGNTLVQGDFHATGTLTAGVKNFEIDHPADPDNKTLKHACIESDEMANIYSGNVTTDGQGTAIVELPAYFEALNADYRYQLTVIGQFAQAIVGDRIRNNRFTIRTDKPGVEVSWQVIGIRKDAYALANPLVVERDKPADKRGKYLHPQAHGKSADMAFYTSPGPFTGEPCTAELTANPGGRSDEPITELPDITAGGPMGRLIDRPPPPAGAAGATPPPHELPVTIELFSGLIPPQHTSESTAE